MSTLAPSPESIKQGDTKPLVATLEDANGLVNLAGVTSVVMRMKSLVAGSGHVPIAGTCDILQSVDGNGRIVDKGKVSYSWATGETDVAGVYGLEWVLTDAFGKTQTFPNDRPFSFEIIPRLT